jgi:tryptophan synthase alpha chain
MSRISEVFQKPGHKALIAYLTVGYPSLEVTRRVVPLLQESGCDLVELGIPFSDPLADGTTIQNASYRALQNGVTPQICLDIARELSQKTKIPLVFMTYYNPVLQYGLDKFSQACENSGIDGLIIPDLPPDEGGELGLSLLKKGLDCIYLLAPSSTSERIRLAARESRGFIYLVSVTGVTGPRENLPVKLDEFIKRVRTYTSLPLCVGFGISSPQQASYIAHYADGIIVGSRLIQILENEHYPENVSQFIKSLRHAIA